MYFLGMLLLNGTGIEKDPEKAAFYLKMAADKGDARSMWIYATMLENGCGVSINKEESIINISKWLLKTNLYLQEAL